MKRTIFLLSLSVILSTSSSGGGIGVLGDSPEAGTTTLRNPNYVLFTEVLTGAKDPTVSFGKTISLVFNGKYLSAQGSWDHGPDQAKLVVDFPEGEEGRRATCDSPAWRGFDSSNTSSTSVSYISASRMKGSIKHGNFYPYKFTNLPRVFWNVTFSQEDIPPVRKDGSHLEYGFLICYKVMAAGPGDKKRSQGDPAKWVQVHRFDNLIVDSSLKQPVLPRCDAPIVETKVVGFDPEPNLRLKSTVKLPLVLGDGSDDSWCPFPKQNWTIVKINRDSSSSSEGKLTGAPSVMQKVSSSDDRVRTYFTYDDYAATERQTDFLLYMACFPLGIPYCEQMLRFESVPSRAGSTPAPPPSVATPAPPVIASTNEPIPTQTPEPPAHTGYHTPQPRSSDGGRATPLPPPADGKRDATTPNPVPTPPSSSSPISLRDVLIGAALGAGLVTLLLGVCYLTLFRRGSGRGFAQLQGGDVDDWEDGDVEQLTTARGPRASNALPRTRSPSSGRSPSSTAASLGASDSTTHRLPKKEEANEDGHEC